MKNEFLKFVPSVLILIAIGLLFIPKTVSYLDVEKFFADTDAYYQRADKSLFKKADVRREDYYYSGVHIGKLWKKLGVGRGLFGKDVKHLALRDEYLFGCGYSNYASCILPFPAVNEYELGDYKALRVSSSSLRFPDYQYLIFKDMGNAWTYFGHIDVFDNKKGEPVFKMLDNGLASVVSLAGMGDGYSTKFMQVYRLDGKMVKLLLAVPSEAYRKGLGLLDFDLTGDFQYADGFLTGNYRITFYAEQLVNGKPDKALPLFTATRQLSLNWDRDSLIFDAGHSDITPTELARVVSGSYARVYMMFRAEFDKLEKAEGIKKEWFESFLSVVREQGVVLPERLPEPVKSSLSEKENVSAPLSRSRRR